MPYYQRLFEWLVLAPHRLNSAGEIELTVAEAATLRACGFVTAAPAAGRFQRCHLISFALTGSRHIRQRAGNRRHMRSSLRIRFRAGFQQRRANPRLTDTG